MLAFTAHLATVNPRMRSNRLYCLPAAAAAAHGRICAYRGAAHVDPNLQAGRRTSGPGRIHWTGIMTDVF